MGQEEQFILLALGWVFIFLRIFVRTRQVGVRGWELDDYLMPLAGVSFCSGGFLPGPFARLFFFLFPQHF